MSGVETWGADVPVSMPEPIDSAGLVPMFGFTFTIDGLRHDLTEAEHERLSRPSFAPMPPADTVWGDADLEDR